MSANQTPEILFLIFDATENDKYIAQYFVQAPATNHGIKIAELMLKEYIDANYEFSFKFTSKIPDEYGNYYDQYGYYYNDYIKFLVEISY